MNNLNEYGRSILYDVSNLTMEDRVSKLMEYYYQETQKDITEQMLYGTCQKCVCSHRISEHIKDIPYEFNKRYPCTECKCPGLSSNNLEYLENALLQKEEDNNESRKRVF